MAVMPGVPREERLAVAFVELSDTLVRDFDVISFLYTVTEHCVDLLDVAAAGVLLGMPQGQVVEAAASDDRTRALELSGVEGDEGPCRDCYHDRAPVSDVRLDTEAADRRWPRFAPRARQLASPRWS
ncbi:transcriptional regulator, partial [Streptomyces sp. NPDC060205]